MLNRLLTDPIFYAFIGGPGGSVFALGGHRSNGASPAGDIAANLSGDQGACFRIMVLRRYLVPLLPLCPARQLLPGELLSCNFV